MFDRLDDLLIRYEELMEELGSPEVASDTNRFRKLMKEQSDLAPIVEAYKEYKKAKQDVEDSLALLDEESDEEMREMAKEELNAAKKRIEVSLDALLRCLLFVMFPATVFHNPALALFFADFSQRRNPLRFGKSVCCSERSLRCGKSLRPGCVVYLTVRIALRDRSV